MRKRLRGPVPLDRLRQYVLEARGEVCNKRAIPILFLPDTYFIRHSSGPFRYRSLLFGERRAWRSNKVEAVALNDRLVWHGLSDFGVVFKRLYTLEKELFEFLDDVLAKHPDTRLDQIVEEAKGKWSYLYDGQGYIDECFGSEMLFWDDRLIARGFFSGRLHTRY